MDIQNALPEPTRIQYRRPIALGARGALQVPEPIRAQMKLEPGDLFLLTVEDGRIIFTPATVVPSPDADKAAAGRFERFDNDQSFVDSFDDPRLRGSGRD